MKSRYCERKDFTIWSPKACVQNSRTSMTIMQLLAEIPDDEVVGLRFKKAWWGDTQYCGRCGTTETVCTNSGRPMKYRRRIFKKHVNVRTGMFIKGMHIFLLRNFSIMFLVVFSYLCESKLIPFFVRILVIVAWLLWCIVIDLVLLLPGKSTNVISHFKTLVHEALKILIFLFGCTFIVIQCKITTHTMTKTKNYGVSWV